MNKHVMLATLTACLLGTNAAVRAGQPGEHVNRYLYHKGERIETRLDHKGDGIDYRLDARGDRIDRQLDRASARGAGKA